MIFGKCEGTVRCHADGAGASPGPDRRHEKERPHRHEPLQRQVRAQWSAVPVSYTHLDVYKRQELALEYADRIIGIRAGKIVYDGPSDKVDQAVLDSICLLYTSCRKYDVV